MLTKRLEKIVSALPTCAVLADVGCDHGYIGVSALQRNKAQQVVFIDISAPSLQKAQQLCSEENLLRSAEFLCQNGLQKVQCNCAVIAGMGGLEILSVLQNAKTLPQFLVLQPMRSQSDVRRWLQKQYNVVSDEKFFDGKFYDLIFAVSDENGCALTEDEVQFGKTNLQNPSQDFVDFLQIQLNKYNQILQQCNDAEIVLKRSTVLRILAKIQEEQT